MPNKVFPFKPVQRNKRLFETVANEIKQLIIKGLFKPGDKLPPEGELTQMFKVGRQTIREAMRLLELCGFVEVVKGGGGGPIVKNRLLSTVNNLLLDVFQLQHITLEDITVTRFEIEKSIVPYAIKNAERSDIDALKENISMAKEKISKGLIATDENIQFHNILANATKNQALAILMNGLSKRSIRRHEELLDAVVKKDNRLALRIITKHIDEVGRQLQEFRNLFMNFGS
jgi:GntR family transcriptional repressor for pyruvate dehydrogenase complex